MLKKEELKKLWSDPFYRVSTILFFLVLILNILTIQIADDYGYKVNNGLFDIFHREYIQYMTWTGRTIAHIIARTFLALPKIIFDIFNSACFVALCHFVYLHSFGKEKHPLYLWMIALLIFLFAPLFGQTILWETGACNYLWTTTIVLGFLWVFRTNDKVNPILFFLFGIIAGWTNENTGGALILLLIGFIVFSIKFKKEKVASWKYVGLIGVILGFALLILAPGNRVRALDFVSTEGLAYNTVHDIMNFIDVLEQGEIVLWILFVVLLTFNWIHHKKENIKVACFFAIASIAAVAAIIVTPVPVLYDRSMFGACIFLIIAIMILVDGEKEDTFIQKGILSVFSIFVLLSCFAYGRAFIDLTYTRYQDHQRKQYIEVQRSAGNLNPTVANLNSEFFTKYNPMFGMNDITPYRLYWVNRNYAESNHLESIQATPLDRWSRVYKDGNPTLMNMTDFNEYMNYLDSHAELEYVVNSTELDTFLYEEYLNRLLNTNDVTLKFFDTGYLIGDFNGLSYNFYEDIVDGMIDGHYYYISSMRDESQADVLFDGIELTNDRPGITMVVYDKKEKRVVDVVTWTYDSDQGGTRYYKEK